MLHIFSTWKAFLSSVSNQVLGSDEGPQGHQSFSTLDNQAVILHYKFSARSNSFDIAERSVS